LTDFPDLENRLLVVYDGECAFCNTSIRWFLRQDGHDRLRFAPSSDPAVQQLLASHGISSSDQNSGPANSNPGTILVFRNVGAPVEELLVRSNAVLACLRFLPQPWPAIAAIFRLIPRPLREWSYRFVADNRYRIAGRYDSCPIPTPEERGHFL
jgi:predicted DCC family thiol-disulfide oxidoreductase YuxK